MSRTKKTAVPEIASERVEVRLTPSQMAEWERIAKARGLTIKALAVEAVAAFGARDAEGDLAELGRKVADLVKAMG